MKVFLSPIKRRTLRIPEYLDSALKNVAFKEDKTVTSLITRAIYLLLWGEYNCVEEFDSIKDFVQKRADVLESLGIKKAKRRKIETWLNNEDELSEEKKIELDNLLSDIQILLNNENPWFLVNEFNEYPDRDYSKVSE